MYGKCCQADNKRIVPDENACQHCCFVFCWCPWPLTTRRQPASGGWMRPYAGNSRYGRHWSHGFPKDQLGDKTHGLASCQLVARVVMAYHRLCCGFPTCLAGFRFQTECLFIIYYLLYTVQCNRGRLPALLGTGSKQQKSFQGGAGHASSQEREGERDTRQATMVPAALTIC